MNSQINNDIIQRTTQIFATMFQLEVEAGLPYILDPDSDTGWDISGVISVAGSLSGIIALRYHNKLTDFMLERARIKTTAADVRGSLLCDMVGEVSNTIAGNVLSDTGIADLYPSIPVSIRGENHMISWPKNTEITVVPFSVGPENFVVQAGLK